MTPGAGRAPRLLDGIDAPSDLRRLPRAALAQVAGEVRAEMIEIVSGVGGHLGAGLGVVELTTALHWVFDTPDDKLIWDVSHQCYPHKILTGRRQAMRAMRQDGGPAGFTSRRESVYDPFGAAHSSTAISAALGFAAARDYEGRGNAVVAIVGDGAMSGGMAYEGLNNAGASGRPLIVILNDNDMSIAPPSGALSRHLRDLRARRPEKAERLAALAAADGPPPSFAGRPTLFDDLGFAYCGPFDGHDVDEMAAVLERARDHCRGPAGGPILIHALTVKGKGYAPAEAAADCYHGVAKFDAATGQQHKSPPKAPSYTSVFAESLIQEADEDPRIVAITAAMPSGTGLDKFGAAHPDRCYDAGIAEQHAVTFCAGLACEGFRPFAAIYSTFLQRAYDQIVHDVAIQQLPVRFAIDRAGMVGADGVTHQGSYDIAYLGCLPGFVLMAPADEAELKHMVATAAAIDDRPSAVRFPRGEGTGAPLPNRGTPLEIGRGRVIREGREIAILSYGARLADAEAAAARLAETGVEITVADARFAKPIDDRLVKLLAEEHKLVLTLEEGAIGGFSAQVIDSLVRQGLGEAVGRVRPCHLPDRFIEHASPAAQLAQAGLDADALAARVLAALGRPVETLAELTAG
ncbi:MAG: 1-deoxy-D-xylulose-5-phosphate synthase [Marivibrio sp.]|uniref:1-deoxy-D-xylulose-5-phosphate synthase n=1 Tax=Marivibrio sp. TaxID=2039719 RepID=UPI0032ED13C5